MPTSNYEDIAFDERAHDDEDDVACYLIQREGKSLTVEIVEGDIEAGQHLIDRHQLFDYMDEFLDRGGMIRMERSS